MGFPKALLKISGETFAECIVRKANLAGIHSIFLITGPDHEAIIRTLPPQIQCIKNEDYMLGQISSLQKGIRELGDATTDAMVWPVDQPLVQSGTVNRIMDAHQHKKTALTIPVYQTRKGHPVIYNRSAMQAALHLQASQTGKDLQLLFSNETAWIEVDDPGVIRDIDTKEDYEKYISGL